VDAVAAEVVAAREESGIGDLTARGDVGVKLGHPCPDPVGIEDSSHAAYSELVT
jgi:hypothetical protein